MKKNLIAAAFILCLAGWSWFGWHYVWPVAVYYFQLLEQRQGFLPAYVGMSFSLVVALWVYYAAAANLKRAIDDKTAPLLMQVLGYTLVLPPTLFLDWLCNMTVFTVLFGDLPAHKTELVTGRLKRYVYLPEHQGTKRQKVARVFALILDALDPTGRHI